MGSLVEETLYALNNHKVGKGRGLSHEEESGERVASRGRVRGEGSLTRKSQVSRGRVKGEGCLTRKSQGRG